MVDDMGNVFAREIEQSPNIELPEVLIDDQVKSPWKQMFNFAWLYSACLTFP